MSDPSGDSSCILVKGARENNLRNLTARIPRGKLIGVTGVSGSGKSSFAFDVLYAEGHRKYVESLSAKARQALAQIRRPDVDYVQGLSPVIAIEQRTTAGASPRSTVATSTEIADYARLLWSVAGKAHCPLDGGRVKRRSLDDIIARVLSLPKGNRLVILAPILKAKPSVLREELPLLASRGYQRIRIYDEMRRLDEGGLVRSGRDEVQVDLVIDRLLVDKTQRSRLADAIELAFREGEDTAIILSQGKATDPFEEFTVTQRLACETCGSTYPELEPKLFSWNRPEGACEECGGLGETLRFHPDLVIPDPAKSVRNGAIKPWRLGSRRMIGRHNSILRQLAEQIPFDLKTPWRELEPKIQNLILNGHARRKFSFKFGRGRKVPDKKVFKGVLAHLDYSFLTTSSEGLRAKLMTYQIASHCHSCSGSRLSSYARGITLEGFSFADFLSMTAEEGYRFVKEKVMISDGYESVGDALNGLEQRLRFLNEVGLGYLGLDRSFGSLSGGEAQRARLATQLGMGLVGVLYILDEPSIGLHPIDNRRLLDNLLSLRDRGNSVVVVEHDPETLQAADHLLEIGPGAGSEGGQLIFSGTVEECIASSSSRTGPFLAGTQKVETEGKPQLPDDREIRILGATANNLQNLDASIPVGLLTVVCGVSGSGKSTLINTVLARAAAFKLHRAKQVPGNHSSIEGLEHFRKVARVDQSPVGRSPRSNPATYVKLFDAVRRLFSQCSLSRVRGYKPGRFSFNSPGGRCERCKGDGAIRLDMHFLADVYVECESCGGKRFNRETLDVRFKGYNVAEVLDMTVSEAKRVFRNHRAIFGKLEVLDEVGLGYLKLGQPSNTLSGGEAQRLKLSLELSKRDQGKTLYLLDEPTTGLHWLDAQRLLDLLIRLRNAGNTIVVIEHNLDFIRCADWVIELGPGGGSGGGRLVHAGTVDTLLANEESSTGRCLAGKEK
ncbi:MAG: excinuclease ABC subunit A [Opitutae bacterium]|nr:excinuclease ABC subunit A [Opitutae bacterium]|tara:strand:+ start:893 stop:3751 length:2859 start_codon:yes stop_codon:yes gene_type:complete